MSDAEALAAVGAVRATLGTAADVHLFSSIEGRYGASGGRFQWASLVHGVPPPCDLLLRCYFVLNLATRQRYHSPKWPSV